MYINNHLAVTAWSFLYRKSLLQMHRQPQGRLCEDLGVTHRYIHSANRIVLINRPLYNYNYGRQGSIWNTPSARLYSDGYDMYMMRIADLEKWGYDTVYQRQIVSLFLLAYIGSSSKYAKECGRYLKSSGKIHKDLALQEKIMIRIYRISPSLFDLVCRITGQRKNVG